LTTGWGVTRGFTWTSGAGFSDCGLLQGDTLGLVWDADEHGSLVMGAAARIDGQYGRKYTGAGGWESLFSGINGAGISVTADASVITGRYGAGNSMEPLYFTSVGGATGVGSYVDVYVQKDGVTDRLCGAYVIDTSEDSGATREGKIEWVTLAADPEDVKELLGASGKGTVSLTIPATARGKKSGGDE